MMAAGGREAGRIATLGWWVLGTVSLTMLVMGVLIVWGCAAQTRHASTSTWP